MKETINYSNDTQKRISVRIGKLSSQHLTSNLKGVSLRTLIEEIAKNDKILEGCCKVANNKEVVKLTNSEAKGAFSRQLKINRGLSEKITSKLKLNRLLTALSYDSDGCIYLLKELGLDTQKRKASFSLKKILSENDKSENKEP